MIDRALHVTVERLNGHLAARFRTGEPVVVLAPLTDAEGKPADAVKNRLALFVVNIAEDTVPRNGQGPRASAGGITRTARPIHLDIYAVLASAHEPDRYLEGLKLLSAALLYFQAQPVLTAQGAPDLPPGLDRLSYELANLRIDEISQLWSNLGGRYVPSVLFKIRSCTLDADAVQAVEPSIRGIDPSARPGGGR